MLKMLAYTRATISPHLRAVVIFHPLSYPDHTLGAFALPNSFPVSPVCPPSTKCTSCIFSAQHGAAPTALNAYKMGNKRRHYLL